MPAYSCDVMCCTMLWCQDFHRAVEQILGYKLPGFHGGVWSDYGFRVLTLCSHVVTLTFQRNLLPALLVLKVWHINDIGLGCGLVIYMNCKEGGQSELQEG